MSDGSLRVAACLLWLLPALAWADEPIPVTVQVLKELAIYPRIEAPATVVSLNHAQIGAEISAPIEAVAVQVGDRVRRGDPLVRLDCTDYRLAQRQADAALAGSRAQLRLAEYRLERARALARSSNVSEELLVQREVELDALQAEILAREAALAAARENVARCDLKAPFDGVVVARMAQVGELAVPGKGLVELQDVDGIEVSAQVPGALTDRLLSAAEIQFQDDGTRYPLRVRAVVAVRDPRARTQEVRLLFTAERASPGTAGRVTWRNGHPYVAPEMVERRGGALGLFVAEGESARFHRLPGAQEGRPARIDLPLDTPVIVAGRINVVDGSAIRRQ